MGKIHVVDFNEDASVVASGEYVTYTCYRLGADNHYFPYQAHTTRRYGYGIFGSIFWISPFVGKKS